MIDVRKLCQEAVAGVPLSLKDDPTTWSDEPTRDDVRDALSQATYDNVASALAVAFGRESERIATLMDAAIAEDGPLADLDAIWDAEVANGRTRPELLALHLSADWDTRVNDLRAAIRDVVVVTAKSAQSVVTDEQIDAMIEIDPRLATIAEPYVPPAFLNKLPDPEPDDEPFFSSVSDIDWGEEPTETAKVRSDLTAFGNGVAHVADDGKVTHVPLAEIDWSEDTVTLPATGRRSRGKRAGAAVPLLSGLLEAAGFADKDVARLLGIDKSTYSLARAGKRPWQGLRDEQAIALRAEIRARADALAEALVALDSPEVRHPSTPS